MTTTKSSSKRKTSYKTRKSKISSKKLTKKLNRKKVTNNIKLQDLKLSIETNYKLQDSDIKDTFKVLCENKIKNLNKNTTLTLNSKELRKFCKCVENKLTIKNIKNINNKYFKKCITKIKKDNNKRLTKLYSSKIKKSKNKKRKK